jgi:hypothetical protein
MTADTEFKVLLEDGPLAGERVVLRKPRPVLAVDMPPDRPEEYFRRPLHGVAYYRVDGDKAHFLPDYQG